MYNGRAKAWQRGGVVSIKTGDINERHKIPSTESYHGPDANAVNEYNGYTMDAVPFISVASTNADMTNPLMHEKRQERRRNYDYKARAGTGLRVAWTCKMVYASVTCSSVPMVSIVRVAVSPAQLTKLVAAAAVARSGFPLMLRVEARGNPVPDVAAGLFDARLAGLDGGSPLTVEWRFPPVPLTGEFPDTPRLRGYVPLCRLAPGGSGSGRTLEVVGVPRLTGEFTAAYILGRECNLTPVMNSCFNAS